MNWFNSTRRPVRWRVRAVPNLEPLETRWVPSNGLAIAHAPVGLWALPGIADHSNPRVSDLPGNDAGDSSGQRHRSGGFDMGYHDIQDGFATARSAPKTAGTTTKGHSHTHAGGSHDGHATASKGKTKESRANSGASGASVALKLKFEPPGTTEGSGGTVGNVPPSGGGGGTVGNVPPSGGRTVGNVPPSGHRDSDRNLRTHINPRAAPDHHNHKATRAHPDTKEQGTTTAIASRAHRDGLQVGTVTASKGRRTSSMASLVTRGGSVPVGPKFQPPWTTEHGGYTVGNQPGNGNGGPIGIQPGDGGGVVGTQAPTCCLGYQVPRHHATPPTPLNGSPATGGHHFCSGSSTAQSRSQASSATTEATSRRHTGGSHHGRGTTSKGKKKTSTTSSGTSIPRGGRGPTFRPPGTTEFGSGGNNNTNLPPGTLHPAVTESLRRVRS
jgi:hypothetical protein